MGISSNDIFLLHIEKLLPAPGAIVVEWNVHDPSGEQGAAGMWDSHFRLGSGMTPDYMTCLSLKFDYFTQPLEQILVHPNVPHPIPAQIAMLHS